MLISFLTSSSTALCRPNQCSCSASLKNLGHGIRLWGPLLLSVKLGGKSSRITVGTCVRAFLHALLCWTLAICHLRWTPHLNIASFVEMRGLLCSCLFLYPWMIFFCPSAATKALCFGAQSGTRQMDPIFRNCWASKPLKRLPISVSPWMAQNGGSCTHSL